MQNNETMSWRSVGSWELNNHHCGRKSIGREAEMVKDEIIYWSFIDWLMYCLIFPWNYSDRQTKIKPRLPWIKVLYNICPIHLFTHTFIHWQQRLPRNVPTHKSCAQDNLLIFNKCRNQKQDIATQWAVSLPSYVISWPSTASLTLALEL